MTTPETTDLRTAVHEWCDRTAQTFKTRTAVLDLIAAHQCALTPALDTETALRDENEALKEALRNRIEEAAELRAARCPVTRPLCECKADTELGMAPGCAVCGHRDHGASGCRAFADGGSR